MVTGLTEISIESKEQVRTPTTASDGDSAVVDAAAVVIAIAMLLLLSLLCYAVIITAATASGLSVCM